MTRVTALEDEPMTHRVIWEQNEHGATDRQITCLGGPGDACWRGCPDSECEDWSHWGGREAGCPHCGELCDCDCGCGWPLGDDVDHGWDQGCPPCDIAQQHCEGVECPHRWVDLDHCWVLDTARAWGWKVDLPNVPPGRWALTFAGWTSDEDVIVPTNPGHPVRVIQPQQGGTQ